MISTSVELEGARHITLTLALNLYKSVGSQLVQTAVYTSWESDLCQGE